MRDEFAIGVTQPQRHNIKRCEGTAREVLNDRADKRVTAFPL